MPIPESENPARQRVIAASRREARTRGRAISRRIAGRRLRMLVVTVTSFFSAERAPGCRRARGGGPRREARPRHDRLGPVEMPEPLAVLVVGDLAPRVAL